jgi:hypothetical protein
MIDFLRQNARFFALFEPFFVLPQTAIFNTENPASLHSISENRNTDYPLCPMSIKWEEYAE